MSELVQTSGFEETVPTAAVVEPASPSMLRLAYCFEFLLAILVIVVSWTQIGGQGHMDLTPWYVKLACVAGLAWCGVRLTAAIVEQPKVWNRSTRMWLTGVLLAGALMAGVTYYVHLHEVPDEPDTDETSTTSVRNVVPANSDQFS